MTIEKTKGICGGRPRISGTRITVAGILYALKIGMTPEKIVKNLARDRIDVTLEDIQSAIEYATDVVNQNETKQCTECGKNLYTGYPVMCAPCMSRWCNIKKAAKEVAESLSWREKLDWDNLSLEEKVEILASELFDD